VEEASAAALLLLLLLLVRTEERKRAGELTERGLNFLSPFLAFFLLLALFSFLFCNSHVSPREEGVAEEDKKKEKKQGVVRRPRPENPPDEKRSPSSLPVSLSRFPRDRCLLKKRFSLHASPLCSLDFFVSLSLCLVHIRRGGDTHAKAKADRKSLITAVCPSRPSLFLSCSLSLSLSLSRLSLHLHLLPSPPNLPLLPLLYPCPPLPLFPLPPRFLAHNLRREKKKPSLPTR